MAIIPSYPTGAVRVSMSGCWRGCAALQAAECSTGRYACHLLQEVAAPPHAQPPGLAAKPAPPSGVISSGHGGAGWRRRSRLTTSNTSATKRALVWWQTAPRLHLQCWVERVRFRFLLMALLVQEL